MNHYNQGALKYQNSLNLDYKAFNLPSHLEFINEEDYAYGNFPNYFSHPRFWVLFFKFSKEYIVNLILLPYLFHDWIMLLV